VATLALFLAAVGVFGVVGYAVRRRMPEFGVRLALGASPGRLRRDVLRGALPLVALGLGGGVLVGWLAAGAAGAVLFGVEPLDPISLAVAVSAMAGAAFLATWIPARRASRVDPTRAIRAE
jgi:ABC-type antimicrobial peptide transport system permease subunit